jgi:hypothetical protein
VPGQVDHATELGRRARAPILHRIRMTPVQSPSGPRAAESPRADVRRTRIPAAARRVAFGAEVLAIALGALGMWQARAAGQAISRPAAIAFWAGLVALVASVVGPRVRAYVQRRRRGGT